MYNPSDTVESFLIEQKDRVASNTEASFRIQVRDDDLIELVTQDHNGFMTITRITYDTAHALQTAISDAMDKIEETLGLNL